MGLSKSTKIWILLVIDTVFFLVELITGYANHSLALVADSFHMLNDVLSLCVGLWAVKVANQKTNSKTYTYGWQRAETLGALINGVFLVALCLSIFLEAIQRFVEPQEVSNPKLVVIVGCWGLGSNIVGLFLFHDHSHGHGDEMSVAEEGHVHRADAEEEAVSEENGNVAQVLPQSVVGVLPSNAKAEPAKARPKDVTWNMEGTGHQSPSSTRKGRPHSRTRSRGYSDLDNFYMHPASFRSEIIAASRVDERDSESDSDRENAVAEEANGAATETSPLLGKQKSKLSADGKKEAAKRGSHAGHRHNQPKEGSKSGGHGHSHDLNMRGVFLHVLGDALGNIGVIASGLIIWLTPFWWRFYSDPAISLIITVIILCSAIPLCKAASRILLQAVPSNIDVDDITDDITKLDGVISCHHLHVWQLSDTKLIASLHVQLQFDFKGEGSTRYMALAKEIRECLHQYGIHSSTIQPEFCLDAAHDHAAVSPDDSSIDEHHPSPSGSGRGSARGSKTGSVRDDGAEVCLLSCSDSCADSKQCCTPGGAQSGAK